MISLLFDSLHFFESGISRIIYITFGGLIIWIRTNVYFYMKAKWYLTWLFSRKKFILIWNDDSPEITDKIIQKLEERKTGNFRYVNLKTPGKILFYPSNPKQVHAIIIIVTDVTKLDENLKKRIEIETRLIEYVKQGGLLIGTHDLIYKRCRNEKLQKAFGCNVKKFQSVPEGIKASVNEKHRGHPLLKNIPDTLILHDNEIITGDWDNSTLALLVSKEDYFKTGKNAAIPLLCVNNTHKGLLIWISCGDKGDEVCESIKNPKPYFIQILYNALRFTKMVKKYNKRG